MPRGGRREGAGRKPVLDIMARLAVGAHCERLWRDEQALSAERAIAKATSNVRVEWKKAASIPISKRGSWLRSDAYRDFKDDVELAIREQLGTPDDDEDTPRILRIDVPRPKGKRDAIIKHVATQESATRGTEIAESMVRNCWKEFRLFSAGDEPASDL